MTISSRTPEGIPGHCPICNARVVVEPSQPLGDAPCPHCGHLLWLTGSRVGADPESILRTLMDYRNTLEDSLDIVELVMQVDEEFGIVIPDDEAEKIKTVAMRSTSSSALRA